MASKRMQFLNSLRSSVYKSSQGIQDADQESSIKKSDDIKESDEVTLLENKGNVDCSIHEQNTTLTTLQTDLHLSSNDSYADPTFSPDESTTDDDIIFDDENTTKKSSKKSTFSTTVETAGVNNNVDTADGLATQPELPVAVAGGSQDCTTVVVSSSRSNNNNHKSQEPKKRYKADPSKWKRNVNRRLRLSGQSYVTVKGKIIPSKPMQAAPCINRQHDNCSKISEDARREIYASFHSLVSLKDQREFFLHHVKENSAKRKTVSGDSRKSKTKVYSFSVRGEKFQVCREFFLKTLGISEGLVRGAFRKVNSVGILEQENRGKKLGMSDDQKNLIEEHIMQFPAVESHYCRKSSEFRYLNSELNIRKMYNLYKVMCDERNLKHSCFESYRKVFREYKLTFHTPKKDECKTCTKFNESTKDEQHRNMSAQTAHLSRKESARAVRDDHKQAAIRDSKTCLSFNFDLQAVLQTPKGAAGPFFYARKLAVYNLTVYNLGDAKVNCFIWDETEGKRGSVEISTCIFKYILDKPEVTHVRMMSDSCGGQQKNFHFSSMCLYTLQAHPNLQTIDHVFFESGHSHMECDSVHSKIERKAKNTPVYTPSDWDQLIRLARTNPSAFDVIRLLHGDFLNFNTQQDNFVSKNEKVRFTDCVWFQYRKTEKDKIFVKTDYNDNEFKTLFRKRKRGIKNVDGLLPSPHVPYTDRLCISEDKKQDLLKLCQQGLIPRAYHNFFELLPTNVRVVDRLPEPDANEEQ